MTTFAYSNSAPQVTATVNGRWTRTSYDGLGRTVKVETGTGGTVVSVVETEYGACACSPIGKVKKVSLPYAPTAPVYWTEYTFDALGRTTEIKQPNGSGRTLYQYTSVTLGSGSGAYPAPAVTVTDAAGKWKKMAMDGYGNLVEVEEPNPAGGTWKTSYSYSSFNQLTLVTMPRPTGTQTRTFVYNSAGQLTSVTQPASFASGFGVQGDGDDDVWVFGEFAGVEAGCQAAEDGL